MQDMATVTNWPLHMHYGITLWAYLSVALIKDSHEHLSSTEKKKTQYCVLQVTWSQLLLRRWTSKSARRQNREKRHTDRHTNKTNTTRCTVNLIAHACQGLISSGYFMYRNMLLYCTWQRVTFFLDANVHCLSRQTIFAISQTSLQVSVSSCIQLSCERNHPGLLIASVSLYIHQWINMHAFK